jgi:hypothetical protein
VRTKIDYRYVAPNTREFEQMQTFASSFDHCILPDANTNVHAFYRGDTCFGYADSVFIPVVYPAFHPALTRPQDVIQVMNDWRASTQWDGKRGYIGVPSNNNDGKGNFPEETMNKLGLVRLNREIYSPL